MYLDRPNQKSNNHKFLIMFRGFFDHKHISKQTTDNKSNEWILNNYTDFSVLIKTV